MEDIIQNIVCGRGQTNAFELLGRSGKFYALVVVDGKLEAREMAELEVPAPPTAGLVDLVGDLAYDVGQLQQKVVGQGQQSVIAEAEVMNLKTRIDQIGSALRQFKNYQF